MSIDKEMFDTAKRCIDMLVDVRLIILSGENRRYEVSVNDDCPTVLRIRKTDGLVEISPKFFGFSYDTKLLMLIHGFVRNEYTDESDADVRALQILEINNHKPVRRTVLQDFNDICLAENPSNANLDRYHFLSEIL